MLTKYLLYGFVLYQWTKHNEQWCVSSLMVRGQCGIEGMKDAGGGRKVVI